MHGGAPTLWEVEFPFEGYANKLFSEVYDLAPSVFRPTELVFGLTMEPTPGFDAKVYLSKKLERWFQKMKFRTPAAAEWFARSVDDFAERALQELLHTGRTSQKRLSQLKAEHEIAKKSLTQTSKVSRYAADMKTALERLLDDARRLTKQRGMKAKLAKALKMPHAQARLSGWLKGQHAPAGEAAFRLRELVDHPERWTK